ncbi:MAG: NUDIX hydrolase [uncultured bacterium]|nr:MAG: NUDIX hydrolase [uncultured bacterium]
MTKSMKIPKHAKKVFTGKIFDVYHYDQKIFDGTTVTFEILKRPNSLTTIPVVGNKIIIAKERQPGMKTTYNLFGGRQEPNEKPLAGAKRELLEEAGLKSTQWKLFKEYRPYEKIDWSVFVYIAKNCKKVQDQQLDAGEKIQIKEVSFDEFIDIALSDNFYSQELTLDLCKLKCNNKLNEFKKLLFK